MNAGALQKFTMAKKQKIVWDRVNDYVKKYQSGFDAVEDYNGKFYQVQYELANYLISIHAINEKAQELLQPLIVSAPVTASSTGFINKPAEFMYYLSGSYEGKPIHKLSANQLDTYELLPQRRGDLDKKRVNITGIDGGWEARPATAFSAKIRYVKQPPVSTIAFTIQSTEDEDILAYDDDATVDFVWSDECINLIVYMMLEKYGVSMREKLLQEYSQLGLAKEAVK